MATIKETLTALDYLRSGKPVPPELDEATRKYKVQQSTGNGMDSWYRAEQSPFGFHGGEWKSAQKSGFHD